MSSVSLINGHIDLEITPEMRLATFNDELEELVDMFYDGCRLCQFKYFEDIFEEVLLEDAIKHLFSRYKDIISIYSIETDTCFESCGYDVGVISIAFVNPITGLEHHLLRWERV